jgi:hypothetical protein
MNIADLHPAIARFVEFKNKHAIGVPIHTLDDLKALAKDVAYGLWALNHDREVLDAALCDLNHLTGSAFSADAIKRDIFSDLVAEPERRDDKPIEVSGNDDGQTFASVIVAPSGMGKSYFSR